MISFYIDNYKLRKIRVAADDYKLLFRESNSRGADGKYVYGFYELLADSSSYYNQYTNVSRGWSIDEAYAVLKTRGDFSHIKKEGSNRGDYSPSFSNENNRKSIPKHQLQDKNSKEPWVTLENGKKHYTRATFTDIALAIIIPIIGPILGLAALTKKEYKRGWTIIAVSLVTISIVFISNS
jgi:hypothetical protein